MKSAKPYIQQNQERFINELIDLIKIPSISADSNYKGDVIKTAEMVKLTENSYIIYLHYINYSMIWY